MAERDGLQYLHKREDGRHVFRVRPYVGTPRRRVTKTFDMPTDAIKPARKRAIEVVQALEAGADVADVKRPTIAQLLDDWIERGSTKSPRTLHEYRRRADRIAGKFGKVRADHLTPDMVDGWYHELRRGGTSESEILELHRVFSAALQWARKLRRITEAATEFVETPRHRPQKIDPPDVELMKALLTGLPDHEWARAVSVLVLTGMRRGEVCGLQWDDLDVHGQTLWVRRSVLDVPGEDRPVVAPFPKSREHRQIELHPATIAVLELQRDYVASTAAKMPVWVFPDWNSWRLRDPRRPGSVSRSWDRYRKKHGGESVRVHDLRHFHATQALASGARVHDVAAQLGHKDAATTIKIYGHGTDDGRRKVVDGVAGVLGLGAPESPAPTPPPE